MAVERGAQLSGVDPRAGEPDGAGVPDAIDLRTCPTCRRPSRGAAWCQRCLPEFPPELRRQRSHGRVRYELEVTYSLIRGNAVTFGIVGRLLFTAPWVALVAGGVWVSSAAYFSKIWILPGVGTAIVAIVAVLALRETWRPARHVKVRRIIELD